MKALNVGREEMFEARRAPTAGIYWWQSLTGAVLSISCVKRMMLLSPSGIVMIKLRFQLVGKYANSVL